MLISVFPPFCRSGCEDAVQQYMTSMGDVGVLAKEEEMQLGAIIHLGQQVGPLACRRKPWLQAPSHQQC